MRPSLTALRFFAWLQGPCYDFMQQPYKDMVGNTTLHNCMKDKLAAVGPSCMNIPDVGAMSRETLTMGQCGGGMGGTGGMRRGGHVMTTPCPTPPEMSAIDFTKEKFDTMVKGIFKGMVEGRCDPDKEIKDEDKDK